MPEFFLPGSTDGYGWTRMGTERYGWVRMGTEKNGEKL